MQSNSAGITVLLGIESHGVFSFRLRDLPVYRFGGELEGEGSMSIKRMQSDQPLATLLVWPLIRGVMWHKYET